MLYAEGFQMLFIFSDKVALTADVMRSLTASISSWAASMLSRCASLNSV